ncbi:MAG: LacI family DNA-binding transcriptional regulator, partial [Mobilitalea sp.]
CTGYTVEEKEKYMSLLLEKRTDAIILVGSNFVEADEEKNQYIRQASKTVPIMIINGALNGENVYCTLCDDFHAVYEATKSLQQSGHKDILYLYNAKSYSANKKLSGYISAMETDGRSAKKKEELIQFVPGSIIDIKSHLSLLHKKGLSFDAIITSDDSLAIAALKFAKDNAISVPDQLSIIGYNNSILALCSDPELTSIDNKLESVCNNCISALMGVFKGSDVPLRTVFSGEIIKRGTTRF